MRHTPRSLVLIIVFTLLLGMGTFALAQSPQPTPQFPPECVD